MILLIVGAFWSARPPAPGGFASASPTLELRVDLSERTLVARAEDGEEWTYGVAVGTSDHPTPHGSFRIDRIIWNPRWVPPDSEWARDLEPAEPGDPHNPMGRIKMYFRGPAYYIHGTPDEASIGRAASHGCIRMRDDDIVELARLVMEHGGEPREPGWFHRILNHVRSTEEVRLSDPVPLEILP